MASVSASAPTSSVTCTFVRKKLATVTSPHVVGLPTIAKKGKVACLMEKSSGADEKSVSKGGMGVSLMAAAGAVTMSSPAVALVDERMTTEGIGLPFGLSNNLLGWILLGIFGLIWSFYIVYTSTLDEDEDSGLSL